MPEGLVDTNVFIHANTTDALSEECARFLTALKDGRQFARLEEAVVHELSFAWRHVFQQASRDDIATYLLTVLTWPGIVVDDRSRLIGAVRRWQASSIGFIDALLSEKALEEDRPVYTKNRRDFRRQGVDVP